MTSLSRYQLHIKSFFTQKYAKETLFSSQYSLKEFQTLNNPSLFAAAAGVKLTCRYLHGALRKAIFNISISISDEMCLIWMRASDEMDDIFLRR